MGFDIKDVMRRKALEEISNVDLSFLFAYARRNADTFQVLRERGIINDGLIESALENAVFERAKKDYKLVTRDGEDIIHPDHLQRPDVFAYALSKGLFSEKELKGIKFDHGENPETFNQLYGVSNLLSGLREELLHPKPIPKETGDCFRDHTVCYCD